MEKKLIPGTAIPDNGSMGAGMFASLRPMIAAANGLTLAQVCAITELEPSTVQNWVKREFVAHPAAKKYGERHLARILIISMLRDSMKIDDVGELLRFINGNADDESDDIIAEPELYDLLCEVIRRTSPEDKTDEIAAVISDAIGHYSLYGDNGRERLAVAMRVMVYAYFAGELVRKVQSELSLLRSKE
jgi:DNA-binding transcriptional MerR regulator